jgi:hypothetical protein
MQDTVFLINPSYLKKFYSGYIDGNVDDEQLQTFILIAQNENLTKSLGYTLYSKFITDYTAFCVSGTPLATNYQYLKDNFIDQALSLWTLYHGMLAFNYKITNKAVVTRTSEQSTTVDVKVLYAMRDDIKNRAQNIIDSMRAYICNHPTYYPEYFSVQGINNPRPELDPLGDIDVYFEESRIKLGDTNPFRPGNGPVPRSWYDN